MHPGPGFLAQQDSAGNAFHMKFKIIVSFICFYFRQFNAFTRRPNRVIPSSGAPNADYWTNSIGERQTNTTSNLQTVKDD